MDESQCITIIDEGKRRFVINGDHDNVPDSNFVELDMSGVGSLGNAVHICWENSEYEWTVVVHNSEVISSTLDESKFDFNTSLPLDKRGIPHQTKFSAENCAVFDYYSMKLSPNQGAIIEIE